MDHGAPETEYDPEMEDFAALITSSTPITGMRREDEANEEDGQPAQSIGSEDGDPKNPHGR